MPTRASAILLFCLVAACSTTSELPPPDCECGAKVCGLVCGQSCGVCPDDGVCAADQLSCRPALPFGSPCSTAISCGTGRLCLAESERAPGGYCSRRCSDTDPCPGDAPCVPGALGENVCLAACGPLGGGADCRTSEGYACDPLGFCPACVGRCDGHTCGEDGCGKSCGECLAADSACHAGVCETTYTAAGNLAQSVWDAAAFDVNGLVTLVGGREIVRYTGNVVASRGVKRVLRFDAQSRPSGTLPELPEAIAHPHAALLGTALYVAGGTLDPDVPGAPDGIATGFHELTSTGWKTKTTAPMPMPSKGGALVAINGKLYLFAGETASGLSARTDEYDPTPDRWTESIARPTARTLAAAVSDGSRAFLIGGWNGTAALATVEVFESGAGWTRASDLPYPTAGARAVIADGRVFVFGGHDGPDAGDPRGLVQTIDLATRRTAVVGTTWHGLVGQAPATLRDGGILLFGATSTQSGFLVPHDEIVKFRVPAR